MTRDPSTDIPRTPALLAMGPVLLLPLLGIAALFLPTATAGIPVTIGQMWAAVLLLFLAGVRRGLSFFTEGGPRAVQIATAIGLFVLGVAGLLLPLRAALVALIVGYAAIGILDPRAARRGEVPAWFAGLRPRQMAVALAGLILLLVRVAMG
ncbi:MAG: DUF3429 domain-containing protein [Sphingomonas fennica]